MSEEKNSVDASGDAKLLCDAKLAEDQQVEFLSSSDDESEAAEAFPREECRKLRSQVGVLSAENSRLRGTVEQLKQQLSAANPQGASRGSKKIEPPRLASEVAAAQVSELSRRLRDMCAELESTRTKQRAAEDKVATLTAELEQLRSSPATSPPAESEDAVSLEELVKQLRERLSAVNAKLCDSRSQCAQVRRELQLAQRALANEVGEAVPLSQLGSFRGRAQQILQLQRRVAELQEKLQVQQGGQSGSSERCSLSSQTQLLQQKEKERRAAQEQTAAALRDTQLQLEDARRRLEGQRARVKVLEAEVRDLKQKMMVLLEKGDHDNQLVAALTSQLQTAEEAAQDKRALLSAELKQVGDRCAQLEQELAAQKVQQASLTAQLAQKDRLAEQLQLRIEQLEQPRLDLSPRIAPSEASATGSSWSPALQAAGAERQRLLELVAVLHTRLDAREQAAAQADARWRHERARAAQLQLKVERMELERQNLVKVGCYRGNNKQLQAQQLSLEERQRLELLEEEVSLQRTRIDALRREKEEDRAKYLSLLQRCWDQEQCYEGAPSTNRSPSPAQRRRGSMQQLSVSSNGNGSTSGNGSVSVSSSGNGNGSLSSCGSGSVSSRAGTRRARSQAPIYR